MVRWGRRVLLESVGQQDNATGDGGREEERRQDERVRERKKPEGVGVVW